MEQKLLNGVEIPARYQLIDIILHNSVSKDWHSAILEWKITGTDIFKTDRGVDSDCLCGKQDIVHKNEITNKLNGKVLYPIGSECIKKFENKEMIEDVKLNISIIKLYNKFKENKIINCDKTNFSRKLLWYLYNAGGFTNNKWNNNNSRSDYQLLLQHFNANKEQRKEKFNTKQLQKIYMIIHNDIKNFIINKVEKEREK